jgi:hypothetical protein
MWNRKGFNSEGNFIVNISLYVELDVTPISSAAFNNVIYNKFFQNPV